MFAGDVYAEIEVMKMVMELRVSESGWYDLSIVIFIIVIIAVVINKYCLRIAKTSIYGFSFVTL